VGVAAACGLAQQAQASGFALREQSAEGDGNAFAGSAAKAYDPSTVFYNPAGMTRLDGIQTGATGTWIAPVARFTGSNSPPTGGTVAGSQPDNGIKAAAIGSAYAVWGASPDWRLGMAVTAPYGMRVEYKEDWVGRYQALASDVTDVEFSPNLAYQVNDQLSIGGGPRFDYLQARLTQAINYRGIATGPSQTLLGSLTPGQMAALAPQLAGLGSAIAGIGDGQAKVDGDDWGVGYALGILYQTDPKGRIGLNYRSRVFHELSGKATYQTPASVGGLASAVGSLFGPAAAGALASQIPVNSAAKAKITTPDSLNLSYYRDINAQWAAMASAEWTHWSVFKSLNVTNSDTGAAVSSTNENWRDTWFLSLGANYKPIDKLTLHGGVAFDESPVKDAYRTPRIPDANRYWLSVGATYAVLPNTDVSFGYTHIFADKATINYTGSTALATGTLTGSYDNYVDVFSLGATMRFWGAKALAIRLVLRSVEGFARSAIGQSGVP